MKFVSRMAKEKVMRARRQLKGRTPSVYINEHLTEQTAKLAYEARQLKRQGHIAESWTWNCKVYAKQHGATREEQKIVPIRNMNDITNLARQQPQQPSGYT